MPKLALILYAGFMSVAFVWRSWLQYRRTGDSGVRHPSASAAPLEWLASVLVIVGFVAIPAVCIGLISGRFDLVAVPVWVSAFGLLIAALGVAITLIAQIQMGEAWRIGQSVDEQTSLVTSGLFAHVRNPIFSGLLVFGLGFVLLVPSVAILPALLVLAAAIVLQVRFVEEPCLIRRHGDAYLSYAQRVGRFLPGVGRFSPEKQRPT